MSLVISKLLIHEKKLIAEFLLASQKKLVESQKKDITDSIFYAKKIQQAILPTKEYTGRILGEHFIMFRAKDIVSGDFYWATKTRRMDDCNGSRLYRTWRSGSFMSMLGVSFLNEIVRKKEVTNMAEVLNLLRSSVIEALRQTGEKGTRKDGMDMSIIAIHKDRKRALWAGANNPLWIIRNENIGKDYEDKTEMIEETKADKMPVTVHIFMDDFTNHEIKIKTGDKLFLFSDGYPDQFGGPKGAKFKYKAFQRLLAETSNLTMKEQGEQLEKTLDNWMNYNENKYEQIDDITIVGLKI